MSFPQGHNQSKAKRIRARDNQGNMQNWTRHEWASYSTAEAKKKGTLDRNGDPLIVRADAIRHRYNNRKNRDLTIRQVLFLDDIPKKKPEKVGRHYDRTKQNLPNEAMAKFSRRTLRVA